MSRFRRPVPERWIADKQELRNRPDADTDQQAQIGKYLRMHELRVIHDDHEPPIRRSVRSHDVEQPFRIVVVDRVFRFAKELGGKGAQTDRSTLAPADMHRRHGARREQLPNGGRHRGLADTRKTGQGKEGSSRISASTSLASTSCRDTTMNRAGSAVSPTGAVSISEVVMAKHQGPRSMPPYADFPRMNSGNVMMRRTISYKKRGYLFAAMLISAQ